MNSTHQVGPETLLPLACVVLLTGCSINSADDQAPALETLAGHTLEHHTTDTPPEPGPSAAPCPRRELWRGCLAGAVRARGAEHGDAAQPGDRVVGRTGSEQYPAAIRWVSYEAFTRPLDLLGLA